MLLEPFSRFFLRHELRFRPERNHGIPLQLVSSGKGMDVRSVLQRAINSGNASLILRNRDVIRLTKMEFREQEKLAIFLFRRSDPDASTPIFEHEKTRKLRRSDKQAEEGIAVSCHLFVRLGDIPDAAHPTYRAILEEVPGLSRTYIQALIGNVLREAVYEYTDHRGQPKNTYSICDFHGLKSEKVGGALKNSTIPYVTLVRPGNVTGLDTEGLVVPRDERLKLEIRATPEKTLSVLERIKTWAEARKWKDVLVEVEMPENRTRLVSIAREADAADILFVRSVQVAVSKPLEACSDVVSEELVTKALALFASDEKG